MYYPEAGLIIDKHKIAKNKKPVKLSNNNLTGFFCINFFKKLRYNRILGYSCCNKYLIQRYPVQKKFKHTFVLPF